MTLFWHALIIVVTIVALWRGALWTVEAAARMARRMGMSELVIGLTVVALGTSLPEFAVSVEFGALGQSRYSRGQCDWLQYFQPRPDIGRRRSWSAP